MTEQVDHPPSAHRIWQAPDITAVSQGFKGIEPLGCLQLINEADCMSRSSESS